MKTFMQKRANGTPRVVEQLRKLFPDLQWGCVRSGPGAPFWLASNGTTVEKTDNNYLMTEAGGKDLGTVNIVESMTLTAKLNALVDTAVVAENEVEQKFQADFDENLQNYKFARDE